MLPRWFLKPSSARPLSPKEQYMHKIESLDRNMALFTPSSDTQLVIERIRQLSEVLIYCDRHYPELLGYFLEKQMHHRFFGLLNKQMPIEVLLQFLQTLSIIVDSIKTENFMYYLLSNNYINKIIAFPFDVSNDEVLAYYVSFLKTLSLRLNPDTIHFFFNSKSYNFPLYTSAIRFIDHEDTMVRIAVKSITLNVYKVESPLCDFYFARLADAIRRHYSDICSLLHDSSAQLLPCSHAGIYPQLNQTLEEHLETIAYINDVFSIGVVTINLVLAQTLRSKLLYPVYLTDITRYQKSLDDVELKTRAHVALVFLCHLVMTLKYPPVINEVAAMLFAEETADAASSLDEDDGAARTEPTGPTTVDLETFLTLGHDDALTMPFLSLCFFLLINKAINPSVLAQSALCPQRLIKTKDILHSLLGSTDTKPTFLARVPSSDSSGNLADQSDCCIPHRHELVLRLLDFLSDPHMPRPVTIDLCAVVLSELVDIPDPIHILCSTHSDILKNVCHRAENILTAYMTDDNNPISALVSGLSQLNMNTFEQRMFNMILEGEVIFPVATNMHAAEDQMTRALHTCFYVGLLLRDHHIKLHSKNVGRVMRVSSAMPMRKEKDVVALGKHPHVPVVVYFQLTQTVVSCVILTDETTDLVLVQPSDSHADSGTVVLAAPLADTKISVTPKPVKPSARVINARDAVFTEQPGRQLTLGGCYYRPGLFTTSNAIQKLDLVLQFKDHATTFYVETKLAALQSQSRLNQVDEITELLGLCWEPTSSLLSTQ